MSLVPIPALGTFFYLGTSEVIFFFIKFDYDDKIIFIILKNGRIKYMPTQGSTKERVKDKTTEPKQYNVIMLNDDFTTMEFVVSVLIDIFKKDPVSAKQIMLFVHKNGRAVVGTYPYDIAFSKTSKALDRAKAKGYPFRMTIEEA